MSVRILETTVLANQSLTADFNTAGVDVSQYDGYFVQANINRSSGNSAGSMKIQVSADNTNWQDYASSTQAVAAADTSVSWEVVQKYHKFFRLVWDNTSGTLSTVSILAVLTKREGA